MSPGSPSIVFCPRCGAQTTAQLFESLNGDRVPAQVDAILDGSFERTTCTDCDAAFQPEHQMLYTQHTARLWIVMYPVTARADYPDLEAEVNALIEGNFAAAPAEVSASVRDIRPRLVFGHHGLREALRSARDAIDPPLLECTKLLAYQHSLSGRFAQGPSELVYERGDDPGQLGFAMRALPTGERLGELWIPTKLLRETRRLLPELTVSHPELFERPYISALRYLVGPPAAAK
jgi:hypothetical protein